MVLALAGMKPFGMKDADGMDTYGVPASMSAVEKKGHLTLCKSNLRIFAVLPPPPNNDPPSSIVQKRIRETENTTNPMNSAGK